MDFARRILLRRFVIILGQLIGLQAVIVPTRIQGILPPTVLLRGRGILRRGTVFPKPIYFLNKFRDGVVALCKGVKAHIRDDAIYLVSGELSALSDSGGKSIDGISSLIAIHPHGKVVDFGIIGFVLYSRFVKPFRNRVFPLGLSIPLLVPVGPSQFFVVLDGVSILAGIQFRQVLGAVACYLVATESSIRAAVGGALAFGASTGLGAVVLDRGLSGPLPVGGVLAPLFAGLFGAPVLLESLRGDGGVPPQADAAVRMSRGGLGVTATAPAVAGAAVAYVPGVSAGVAATVALPAAPSRHPARGYVVASSAANTTTAVFALFALAALDAAHTGVTVALVEAEVPVAFRVLVSAVALAAAAGAGLVVTVGDRYLRAARRIDHGRLALTVLGLLPVLAYLFAGPEGVGVYLAAATVGLSPARIGCRRVHLMGALIGPLAAGL